MSIIVKIRKDVQTATKSGEKELAGTLKYLLSLLQTEKARADNFEPLKVLQKEMKAKREALEMFEKAGREDLITNEKREIGVLKKYLPEMMSKAEVKEEVDKIISLMSQPNFGAVMGQVMGKLKGKAEGNVVAEVVKEKLK